MENQNINQNNPVSDDATIQETLANLAATVVGLLREKNLKISSAESCTSGMFSSLITSVSGSSEIFELGVSAYSSRIKEETLSVPAEVLKQQGAISKETAMYLAKNVRALSESAIGIGITGNAGPTADEGKPIGLVFLGIADKDGYFVKELNISSLYSREKIRTEACLEALELVKLYVESYPEIPACFVPFDAAKQETKPSKAEKTDAFLPKNVFLPLDDEEEDEEAELEEIKESNQTEEVAEKEEIVSDEDSPEKEEAVDNDDSEDLNKTPFVAKIVNFFKSINFANITKFFSNFIEKFNFKTNSAKDVTTRLIFVVSLTAFAVSAIVLGCHFISDSRQHSAITNIQDLYDDLVINQSNIPKLFDILAKENPDIKAWITIENTAVDLPVYQTDNNDFYLDHNMYGESNRYGALFLDYRNNLTAESKSQNLTIYGHNMKDGSMFGTLKQYKSANFYKENPTFKITTPEGVEYYAIFSVMVMNATSKDDNGYLYGFTRSSFSSGEHFLSWIAESLERSLLVTNVKIREDDQIVTLVTCEDEKATFENSRLVVMGKKISKTDAENANFKVVLNPNPRYPQAWYDAKGLDGYKPSETSVIPDYLLSAIQNSATSSSETTSDVASDASSTTDTSGTTSTTDTSSTVSVTSTVAESSSSNTTSNP